jgi:glutamate synthase (NADPH/NADH) small chain
MTRGFEGADVQAGRLSAQQVEANFADLHPPLTGHEAAVAADRCYFCHDAPCVTACPTGIDIPMFIRQIAAGNPAGAAVTIFDQNILGGMCARVCPTETLCEQACVREMAEGKPVEIGRLQRFATDHLMAQGDHPYARAPETGKRVAVVGAGPAGLACAHRLAMFGHTVTVYDAKPKAGGLNEYGIAAYKTVDGFAQAEVDWLLSIGGITVETGKALGGALSLDRLTGTFDAVFLAVGLAGVNALGAPGEDLDGVEDAVGFISELRSSDDPASIPVGRRVIVIGGGMTAIDAAVQSKLLGAEDVTIVYRRGQEAMNASRYEQDLAQTKGVKIKHWARPVRVTAEGEERGVAFEYTRSGDSGLEGTGETFFLPADVVLKAIGQSLDAPGGVALERGRIKVDGGFRTSVEGVWAGGDCVAAGDDLTVTAVAQGRDAAEDIHRALTA